MANGRPHIVVMGVSATGKTLVGRRVAEALGFAYIEGDDHHPPSNVEKMASGTPLTDEDRQPWLEELAHLLSAAGAHGTPTVLACSALRRAYRDTLRSGAPRLFFLHLDADFEVLYERMSQRTKHFMPSSLLRSQFATLERLAPDETGAVVDVSPPVEVVVKDALAAIGEAFGELAQPAVS